jgi:hypothetical protein
MDLFEELARRGFQLTQDRPSRGPRAYSSRPHRFLTYWVHVFDDGTALFTWELAVAELLLEHGIQIGSNEPLNLFMFPVQDDRGPQDAAWLAGAIDRSQATLRALDFATGAAPAGS